MEFPRLSFGHSGLLMVSLAGRFLLAIFFDRRPLFPLPSMRSPRSLRFFASLYNVHSLSLYTGMVLLILPTQDVVTWTRFKFIACPSVNSIVMLDSVTEGRLNCSMQTLIGVRRCFPRCISLFLIVSYVISKPATLHLSTQCAFNFKNH